MIDKVTLSLLENLFCDTNHEVELSTENEVEDDGFEYEESSLPIKEIYSPSCPWGAPGMSIYDFI